MIGRLLCRLAGHRPLTEGALYGACHRCGSLVRARPKLPPVHIKVVRTAEPKGEKR